MADAFNLGRHEALIEQLVEGQNKIVDRMDRLDARLGGIETKHAEERGEKRVKHAMLAAAGGVVGSVVTYLGKLLLAKHGA